MLTAAKEARRAVSAASPTEPVTKACDLCEATSFRLIAGLDRHGRPLPTEICERCGLVSHAKIPSAVELNDFYENQYRQQYHGESTPSDRRIYRAARNGRRLLQRLRPYLNVRSEVLEIGAGIGCTVKALQDAGYRARGIEPHRGFQEFSVSRLGANVSGGSLTDLPNNRNMDLVMMVHVIEHLRSPREALMKIRELLSQDGLLYLECPNLAAPFASPGRLFHYAHIHNFSVATLTLLASRCGYEVVRVFGRADDHNAEILFRKTDLPAAMEYPRDAAAQTLRAAFRYGTLGYHLRPGYLRRRIGQTLKYLRERLVASAVTQRLLIAPSGSAADVPAGSIRGAA